MAVRRIPGAWVSASLRESRGHGRGRGERWNLKMDGEWPAAGEVRGKDRQRRRSPDDGLAQGRRSREPRLAHSSARLRRGSGSTRRGHRRKSPKGTVIPAEWPARSLRAPKLASAVDRDKGTRSVRRHVARCRAPANSALREWLHAGVLVPGVLPSGQQNGSQPLRLGDWLLLACWRKFERSGDHGARCPRVFRRREKPDAQVLEGKNPKR
ncbi:uncharacterized protein CC84DRAFT_1230756 [Paraphaeosphaeria sporulosa]|uniref:Uncharacterized protein n=1 Tax=Paraphaeosphaeria sporulosa TaxID=1460663 RepID=A0A177C1T4_9PLEO|nr:uncharacterized protein CC84DRAFT_1230756 [Paraphaeosphaeria sporulosa]OAG00590.1 hypothetical protein CC84DRAFT_1230756 [Paraphaeosphaeria sporulosa]